MCVGGYPRREAGWPRSRGWAWRAGWAVRTAGLACPAPAVTQLGAGLGNRRSAGASAGGQRRQSSGSDQMELSNLARMARNLLVILLCCFATHCQFRNRVSRPGVRKATAQPFPKLLQAVSALPLGSDWDRQGIWGRWKPQGHSA